MLTASSFDQEPTDVFALGVMLSWLKAGSPPFCEARKTDPLYRAILEGKIDKFWSAHSNTKTIHGPDFYSEDFKVFIMRWVIGPESRNEIQN